MSFESKVSVHRKTVEAAITQLREAEPPLPTSQTIEALKKEIDEIEREMQERISAIEDRIDELESEFEETPEAQERRAAIAENEKLLKYLKLMEQHNVA